MADDDFPRRFHLLRLPVLGENTRSATVVQVLVEEGETVSKGEPLLRMVSDKAEFDFEAEASGTLLALLAPLNSEIPSGFIVAVVGPPPLPDEVLREARLENQTLLDRFLHSIDAAAVWRSDDASPAPAAAPSAARVRATPAARRLAKERGLDLALVKQALRVEGVLKEEHVREFLDRGGSPGPGGKDAPR